MIFNGEASYGSKKATPGDAEKLTDGGLENWNSASDLTSWTETVATGGTSALTQDSSVKHGGSYSARFDVDSTNHSVDLKQNNQTYGAGVAARVSFWYKIPSGKSARFRIGNNSSNVYLKEDGTWNSSFYQIPINGTGNWAQFSLDFTTHASYNVYNIGFASFNSNISYYFDDVSVLVLGSLTSQGAFYYDPSAKYLYLYSTSNPATYYTNIEVVGATAFTTLTNNKHLVFRNLDIRYWGFAGIQAVGWEGLGTDDILVEYCNFSYIGGSYSPSYQPGNRGGNAVTFFNVISNVTVRYCTFDNIYDTAIAPHATGAYTVQTNVRAYYNIINKSERCFESWFKDAGASVNGIYFENNTCLNIAAGWSHAQRTETFGGGVYLGQSLGAVSNFYIRNNIFYEAITSLLKIQGPFTDFANVTLSNNSYYQASGTMISDGLSSNNYTMAQFASYQSTEGKDANSIATDPNFVNYAASDFHLQSTSAAINAGVNVSLTSDYAGTSVPQGSLPDIGAYEYIPLTVTINQKSDQVDPTSSSTINFTVVFSESVSDFATGDVTLGGTAGATTATVTGSGTTYNVAVTSMTGSGTVIASLAAGIATGATGNTNAVSTSTDSTVTYDATAPTVPGTPTTTSLTTNNKPVWTWTASTDSGVGLATTPYSVQWCSNSSFTGCNSNTDTTTTNSYTQVTALTDGTWYFKVKATDAADNSSAYSSSGTDTINTVVTMTTTSSSSSNNSSSISTVCGDQAPGSKTPWLYGAFVQDSGSVLLYFTEADNPVTKYVLEYGTKSGDYPYGVQDMGVNSRGQMTFLVKSLSPNTIYYFKIRGGNGCATGNWSNEISATTKGIVSFNQLDITNSQLETIPAEQTQPTTNNNCQTYTVKINDSLWTIANNLLGDGNRYKEIIEQNKETYPSLENSNIIVRGWEFKVNCKNQATPETSKVTTTEIIPSKSYDVKVKVVDTEKKPVEGANVTLHSTPQTTKTDKNGVASFHNVEQGDHKVLIAYNNFEGEQSINLTGNVKEFDFNVTVQEKAISLSALAWGIIGILVLIITILIIVLVRRKK